MIAPQDRAARIDIIENDDPIESADANEPIEPTDKQEPTEPTDSTDPRDPIDRNESSDHSDHFDDRACFGAGDCPDALIPPILPRRVSGRSGQPARRPGTAT